MVKPIVQIGAPVLNQKTEKVAKIDTPEIKGLIADLLDTCIEHAKNSAGLSAPQINVPLRVCVCRRIDLEEISEKEDKQSKKKVAQSDLWEVMINPEITSTSQNESTYWEGCLSIGTGENILYGPVPRPAIITVSYTTPSGETKELTGKGFPSHVIQHEIDHLEGILFLKYVSNPANIWRGKDLDAYLAKNNDFPPILE